MTRARFCWRERTGRINWRMLRNLEIADVVRRGDATLLEPYALHLTFAKLPVAVSSLSPSRRDGSLFAATRGDDGDGDDAERQRSVWFVVRVLQLAMEYLLFLRARDGAVVDTLQQELQSVERESELLAERAKKWKDRSKSGERQIDKLHHVLQSIAKLLQLEGATPSAVATIESLLRELQPSFSHGNRRADRQSIPQPIEEARVCALCGKMFSSHEYLEKHLVRRHPGHDIQDIKSASAKPQRQAWSGGERQDNQTDGHVATDTGVKAMLRVVEQTLAEHQASLRHVAQEEAEKIHSLYEQLHVETQLVEEMRVNREATQKQVMESQRELAAMQQEKEDVVEQIRELKEQLQFLSMRKKIEEQSGLISQAATPDPTLLLEVKRLEETVSMLKDALSVSRDELTRLQDMHSVLLKDKHTVEAELHEARNHVLRLEASLRGAQEVVPTMKKDCGTQTSMASSLTTEAQTDPVPEPTPVPTVQPTLTRQVDGIAVQTDREIPVPVIDTMIQTDEFIVIPAEQPPAAKPLTPPSEPPMESQATPEPPPDDDAMFRLHSNVIIDTMSRRALRTAHAAAATPSASTYVDRLARHAFNSLPRRKYLRSRFLHDEHSVKEGISTHMTRLEQTAQRYGIQPTATQLSAESVGIVQRALHTHLEVQPAEVLERMVAVENVVISLIKTQWMPQEQSRQQALEHLTATLEVKAQRNQGLVRQAMVAFATEAPATMETSTMAPTVPSQEEDDKQREKAEPGAALVKDHLKEQEEPSACEAGSGTLVVALQVQVNKSHSETPHHEPRELLVDTSPAALQLASTPIEGDALPPSLESVQAVRKQAMAVRSVKVVTVSTKSSPTKEANASPTRPPPVDAAESMAEEANDLVISIPVAVSEPFEADHEPQALKQQGPSSFSSRRTDSQLGIVIPSRYDAAHTDYLVRDSVETEGQGSYGDGDASASDYGHVLSSRESRWGTIGRGAAVLSVASSDLSFNASIPSLHSDDASVNGGGTPPRSLHASVEQEQDHEAIQHAGHDHLHDIVPTREEASDSDESTGVHAPPHASIPTPREEASPPTENDVLAFDDSDIEEVVLT